MTKLTSIQIRGIRELVLRYFKNSKNEPYRLTDGECEIFAAVVNQSIKWLWVSAPTRYGKTDVIAMALIYLAVFHHLKIPVVAGSIDKADKIMKYVVQHLGDNPDLYAGLINLEFSDVEKLKVSVSKNVLRWSTGGWIFITSIEASNTIKEGEGVVGEGGDVVMLEEAGLIKNKAQFSKVVRMPEEDRGWGKLIMAGNCIENSVFEDAYNSDLYQKVRIDLEQAIAEGRYTREKLEEKKTQTTSKDWKRYYLVEFPAQNEFTFFKPKKYDVLPAKLVYFGAIDPALGENKLGSLVGIVVLGVDQKGQMHEVESIGELMKPEEAIRRIFMLPYEFTRFAIEAIQFQKYFLHTIEEKSKLIGKYIPFEALEQKQKKEVRIESLEPAISTGQILFRGDNILWDHMQDYPEVDHLDVLDTLEMAYRTARGTSFEYAFA